MFAFWKKRKQIQRFSLSQTQRHTVESGQTHVELIATSTWFVLGASRDEALGVIAKRLGITPEQLAARIDETNGDITVSTLDVQRGKVFF